MKGLSKSRWIRRWQLWLQLVFRAGRIGRFAVYTAKRFAADGCPLKAAGLGYVSLLSIVPLLAIALGVLSAFPAFEAVREDIQALIFSNLLPETGAAADAQLRFFIDNASKATGPGVLAFAVTAVMLLNNINGALNEIWRVPDPRPLALRFLVYWALLSLGPLLLGSSVSLSSYAFAMVEYAGFEAYTGSLIGLSRLISIALATLGFALIYFVVPNRAVRLGHAFFGGLVAAVLFEVLKAFFGAYVRGFTSYQTIYGAMAAVPVFLIWMYLAWIVVLIGAEIAAALPEWRAAQARGRQIAGPGERLALALGLIGRLYTASQSGGATKGRALVQGLPATPAEIDGTLRLLRNAGVVERSSRGRWVLAWDLTALTLGELATMLHLGLDPGEGWPKPAEQAAAGLAAAGQEQLDRSVAELLTESEEEALARAVGAMP